MKHAIPAAFGLVLLALPVQAQPADPSGTYLSESGDTRVRIAKCGAAYCGTIISVQGEAKDVNNPDPKLKGRNLVGVQMISNIQPSGDGFTGQLYNYKDGKTYTGKMSFAGGKAMQLSGCVLGGLICRSQTWAKVN
ncbi:DUF2147 domain-containing protein [Microvirga arsenatis]|uniref:DUF2147 domain-containing protein n=1 Tax=Microvirga arsenatis TaxID=2692265 RepID=A0ABW9YRU8_9HYPH|nr:DUF2147 domain-containing protein [Microvirga arsenatis]NBJ09919.1 DUF2147 domain-containing protein [Microvirga arsenatis]NBJ22987.1 DUF2147 domain-containing protein [Microvirga arsenatis]